MFMLQNNGKNLGPRIIQMFAIFLKEIWSEHNKKIHKEAKGVKVILTRLFFFYLQFDQNCFAWL